MAFSTILLPQIMVYNQTNTNVYSHNGTVWDEVLNVSTDIATVSNGLLVSKDQATWIGNIIIPTYDLKIYNPRFRIRGILYTYL